MQFSNQGRCECGEVTKGFKTYTFWLDDVQRCFTVYRPVNRDSEKLPVVLAMRCYGKDKLQGLAMTNVRSQTMKQLPTTDTVVLDYQLLKGTGSLVMMALLMMRILSLALQMTAQIYHIFKRFLISLRKTMRSTTMKKSTLKDFLKTQCSRRTLLSAFLRKLLEYGKEEVEWRIPGSLQIYPQCKHNVQNRLSMSGERIVLMKTLARIANIGQFTHATVQSDKWLIVWRNTLMMASR